MLEGLEYWGWKVGIAFGIVMATVVSVRLTRGLPSWCMQLVYASYRKIPTLHGFWKNATDRTLPEHLKPLPVWERISSRTIRVSGLNPGLHTLQGTNTYLIGQGTSRILVDAGEDVTADHYVPHLLSVMKEVGCSSLSAILLTHGHHDHQGGVSLLLHKLKKQSNDGRLPTVYKRIVRSEPKPEGDFPARGFEAVDIYDGEEFRTQGATLKAMFTPGHTDDHVALCLLEDKAILTGDCVLGCGTAVFDDLSSYMNSLRKLKAMFIDTQYRHIYPGHGPTIFESASIKVDEYIAHRDQREREILQTLRDCRRSIKPSIKFMANCGQCLRPPSHVHEAQWNVLQHLRKLENEKQISHAWPDLWTAKTFDETDS